MVIHMSSGKGSRFHVSRTDAKVPGGAFHGDVKFEAAQNRELCLKRRNSAT